MTKINLHPRALDLTERIEALLLPAVTTFNTPELIAFANNCMGVLRECREVVIERNELRIRNGQLIEEQLLTAVELRKLNERLDGILAKARAVQEPAG